jgi:NAD(P)-dependent dehydrogenase (short-subunit alcohol dehydrogenase family)
MMFDLTGKVALVTGAGQSVGSGIAHALAAQGCTVVVNDIVGERAEAVAASIRDAGGQATSCVFDVTDAGAVESAVSAIGVVDILVNNAGNAGAHSFVPTPFVEMEAADYARFIDVNLYAVMHCTRAVLRNMSARGWGRIITISSGAGTMGNRMGISAYGAAKGGAIAFMRHIAMESARDGITANSLALGLMANTAGGAATEQLARTIPVGRLGTPHDIGAACVWLASDEGGWVTGQTITIDGGSNPT